tara:strand:- start:8245 stop:8484 length:240 start_codon:yes stop_codon:yes gene_type:complete
VQDVIDVLQAMRMCQQKNGAKADEHHLHMLPDLLQRIYFHVEWFVQDPTKAGDRLPAERAAEVACEPDNDAGAERMSAI